MVLTVFFSTVQDEKGVSTINSQVLCKDDQMYRVTHPIILLYDMEKRKRHFYGFMCIALLFNCKASYCNVDRTSNTPSELVLVLDFFLCLVPSWANQ